MAHGLVTRRSTGLTLTLRCQLCTSSNFTPRSPAYTSQKEEALAPIARRVSAACSTVIHTSATQQTVSEQVVSAVQAEVERLRQEKAVQQERHEGMLVEMERKV